MGEFRMPSLGADMDEGAIVEWLVGPGDPVSRGQVIAVVDTAKAAIEIESFENGVMEEILVEPGITVPVGTPLARIATASPGGPPAPELQPPKRAVPDPVSLPVAAPPVRHLARQLGVDLTSVVGTGAAGHISHDDVWRAAGVTLATPPPPSQVVKRARVTPRARKLAAERGLDLTGVPGTGAGGAVLAADVERVVRATAATSAPGDEPAALPERAAPGLGRQPVPGRAQTDRKEAMRAAIATLMARSAAEIPHYYVSSTIDVSVALDWLRAHNAELPAQKRVLRAAVFLRATALAARKVPELNGHWIDDRLQPADHVDLGVAVATRGGGLVTPAIPDAGELRVDELMARLADLVRRARGGALRQAEMAGATITVSSLGEAGPEALYGVIFPPQVALVGLGGIIERAWAVSGMLAVRPTITVTIAADHRASDGRTAAAFLAGFTHALDHPEEL